MRRKEKELERIVGFGKKEKLTWCTNGPIFPSCDKRHLNIQIYIIFNRISFVDSPQEKGGRPRVCEQQCPKIKAKSRN